MCSGGGGDGRGGGGVVVEVIVEFPGADGVGNVVAAASTVTAAFARKQHAAFACKGSDCGGGSGGGGRRGRSSRARFVLGCDRVVDPGAVVPVAGSSASSLYPEREATAVAAVAVGAVGAVGAVEGVGGRWRTRSFVW